VFLAEQNNLIEVFADESISFQPFRLLAG